MKVTTTPTVTVLLPVYNGEKYLHETVQSILGQTYSDFEFLIVDDGSTDRSIEIIDKFIDPRIRILKNPMRLKLSGALNRGIDEAKGKYIARMDADDIALPRRLEKQVAFMDKHKEVGVCGTAIQVIREGKNRTELYPETVEEIRAYALFDCPFCHPSVIMRKENFVNNNLYYDCNYYPTEDYELWARAISYFPTANLNEPLLRYRVHNDSMTGSEWDEMDRQAVRIIRTMLENLDVEFSEQELLLHRNIGRGRSYQFSNIGDLDKAERWLQKLVDINKKNKKYDMQKFLKTISLIWFRLCVNNAFLGINTIKKYISCSFAKNDPKIFNRFFVIFLSIVKNRYSVTTST